MSLSEETTKELRRLLFKRASEDSSFLISLQREIQRMNKPPKQERRKAKEMQKYVGGLVLAPDSYRGPIVQVTDLSVKVRTGKATRTISRNLPGLVLQTG